MQQFKKANITTMRSHTPTSSSLHLRSASDDPLLLGAAVERLDNAESQRLPPEANSHRWSLGTQSKAILEYEATREATDCLEGVSAPGTGLSCDRVNIRPGDNK